MESHISFPSQLRSLLLLPQHVKVTPQSTPLLTRLQSLLNRAYTATYCAQPHLFGTSMVRIADPTQISDIIGPDGFTVIVLMISDSEAGAEVVATASVENFGDGDVEQYVEWTKNVSGTQWAAKQAQKEPLQQDIGHGEKKKGAMKPEITALSVSLDHQGLGLGVKVMKEIEWLLSRFPPAEYSSAYLLFDGMIALPSDVPLVHGVFLKESDGGLEKSPIAGIDLDMLRAKALATATSSDRTTTNGAAMGSRSLVLTCVRELGNEEYYKRRGFETIYTGSVPVGMWDCKQECTLVYMEKQLSS